jgi:hypothetical protein
MAEALTLDEIGWISESTSTEPAESQATYTVPSPQGPRINFYGSGSCSFVSLAQSTENPFGEFSNMFHAKIMIDGQEYATNEVGW